MSEPFVAEIRVFGFTFAPRGWAFCDGQLLPVSQNTALFSLLGSNYGGNGTTNFALPNLQGGTALGQAPSTDFGSSYWVGQSGGSETVSLLESEMPFHNHEVQASSSPAEQSAPTPARALARSTPGSVYQSDTSGGLANAAPEALSVAGGSVPHNNMPPVLALNFCIALGGIFPQRP
jgi:microcystin-dependent protein